MLKALVFHGIKDIRIEEVAKPKISNDEILVRVSYAGICGTDARIYNGTKKIPAPRIPGHEFAGTIVEVGQNVKGYCEGERVTVYPMLHCGECYVCKEGRTNICVNRKTIGYEIDGGFAEYVKIPAEAIRKGNVIKIPKEVGDIEAAASEPLAAAYNGILRCQLKGNETVVIIGGGPIGLFHVQLAKIFGAGLIILSEPMENKRKLARELGADLCINPVEEDLEEILRDTTGGEGADCLLMDVGRPEVIEKSLTYIKKGGRYILFAGCPHGTSITIDPNWIHYREIEFTGASSSSPKNHRIVLDLIATGKINMELLITDIFSLSDWKKGFENKSNYEGLKALIDFRGDINE
jgi:L-iditol 2-dehydrogenase